MIFCTEMNVRYENFLPPLVDQVHELYSSENDIKKKRIYLRFLCEMSLCGLFSINTIIGILKNIFPTKSKKETPAMVNLTLDIIKMYGGSFFGFYQKEIKNVDPKIKEEIFEIYQPINDQLLSKFIQNLTIYYNKVCEKVLFKYLL